MPSPPLSIEKFHFAGEFFAPEFCCTQQNKRKMNRSEERRVGKECLDSC